jgi:hypothetical protein
MQRLSRSLVLSAAVAASADAQRVVLELRPRAGDTLRMELEQVTEMSGDVLEPASSRRRFACSRARSSRAPRPSRR